MGAVRRDVPQGLLGDCDRLEEQDLRIGGNIGLKSLETVGPVTIAEGPNNGRA